MRRLQVLCLTALMALGGCDGGEAKKAEAAKATPATEAKPAEAAAPAANALPDAAELLAKVVEAGGGAAKLDEIKSFYQEMQVEILGAGISGVGKTWSKGDDFYLEITLPGVGVSTGGGKAGKLWTLDPIQGLRELTGKEAAMAEMGTSLNIAHDWKRFFDKAETTKVEEVGGKKFAEVVLTASKSGNSVTLRIDLADHRLVAQRLKQFSSMGEIPVEVTLSDYREQNGVWFAFEQVADMKLQKLKTTTTKLELNVPVDETKFAVPGSEPPAEAKPADAKAEAPADAKRPADAKK
ncbi:hypothetical protein [Nannocystis bainbridge]|uniref:Lipoprotein n=1 Tax=Nannocystis bainbridge TaxID=2995303 RepID=A0ABT5DY54_9BACT|nr:hypothetical protein [Nannocystis bainbridge]MDC0718540.1 hypothetical protein [Nannocystis bainbridge]